jgi:VWFA-related protein
MPAGNDSNVLPAALRLNYSQVDAAQFPRIVSYVNVQNDSGKTIGGLTKDNFIVHEDGTRELPIEVVEIVDDSVGVSVVLVMDRSGSMEGQPIADAKNAAITFVQLMSSEDQAALVSFSNRVTTDHGFSKDRASLIQAVNALVAAGGTAIYDAVIHAANLIAPVPGRRALILLTDGADRDSRATFNDAFNTIAPLNVPIYAIGLGPNVGSVEERNLRQLADSTRGRYYYSPTSQELEAIYREISTLLHHQYRISYTTHNCTMDGTLRNVRIAVQYRGLTSFGTKAYRAPDYVVTLAPAAKDTPAPGKDLRIKIEIPPRSKELRGMAEIRVALKYDPQYLKLKPPADQSILIGTLFGAPAEYDFSAQTVTNGIITLYLKRRQGLAPVTGRGIMAEILFTADLSMPDSTRLSFELKDLDPRTDTGCRVAMRTEMLTLYSNGMIVWPGDTNHNGKVELSDALVLGLYWDMAGPARNPAENQLAWMPHLASRFPIRVATYADADGSGSIIERDLIPIGLNWGKTANQSALPKMTTSPASLPEGDMRVFIVPAAQSGQYRLQLAFEPANGADLAGLTFRVIYPGNQLKILAASPGAAWLDQPLMVTHDNAETQTFAMGLMMPAGAPMPTNGGSLVELLVQAGRMPASEDFAFTNVALVAPDGQLREVKLSTGVESTSNALPTTFMFYPAYPNPISSEAPGNTRTNWRYYLPETATVTVSIYNTAGQRIKRFVQRENVGGYRTLGWDGTDEQGRRVGSGLYFVGVEAVGSSGKIYRGTQKISIIK